MMPFYRRCRKANVVVGLIFVGLLLVYYNYTFVPDNRMISANAELESTVGKSYSVSTAHYDEPRPQRAPHQSQVVEYENPEHANAEKGGAAENLPGGPAENLPGGPAENLPGGPAENLPDSRLTVLNGTNGIKNDSESKIVESGSKSEAPVSDGESIIKSNDIGKIIAIPDDTHRIACPVQTECKKNQFAYYIRSGVGKSEPPVICFNNQVFLGKGIDPPNHDRGANVVVIHPKLHTVMDIRVFDLYQSVENCIEMGRYMSEFLLWKAIVMIASYDDMATFLCAPLQKLLTQYGSHLAKDLKFRDGYVLLGEKGLPGSLGKEVRVKGEKGETFPSKAAETTGCSSFPISLKYVDVDSSIKYVLDNCGIATCGYDEIEVHIVSGDGSKRLPKLCIGDTYVFYPSLFGGRGFNLLEFDPLSKTIIRKTQYDTYALESSRMELFLEKISDDNYLIVIVSDDGSTSLKPSTRTMLKEFGFNADVVKMRTVLYFIGQRGLVDTPYQTVKHPANPKAWPEDINERFCLPTELVDRSALAGAGSARQGFCNKHDSFADFCFVHHKSEPLLASAGTDNMKSVAEILDVPILVLSGLNNIALSHSLQSLLKQPGLKNSSVFVAYSSMFGEDYSPFIDLFSFRKIEIPPVSKYSDYLKLALDGLYKLKPESKYIMVVDDEVVTRDGFIWYMGHALQLMKLDSSIAAASAWNPQGYVGVASNLSTIRMIDQFSGLAFLMSTEFYKSDIENKEEQCCSMRSIQNWFLNGLTKNYKFLIPEVSRAALFSSTAYSAQVFETSRVAISHPRTKTSGVALGITLDTETVKNFDARILADLVPPKSYYLTDQDMRVCAKKGAFGRGSTIEGFLPADVERMVVVYEQKESTDRKQLETLYPCFGLTYSPQYSETSYKHVTSFHMGNMTVYLVSTISDFYKTYIQSLSPAPYITKF